MGLSFNFRTRFDPNKYQWRPVSKEENYQQLNQMENQQHQSLMKRIMVEQEQETKNKKNQEQEDGFSVEERTTVGGGGAMAAKAVDIVPRLISFLEKDESFLTPWNSDSNSYSGSLNQQGRKSYHQFQSGSFFVREYPEYFGSLCYYPGPTQSDSIKPSS